MLSLKIPLRIVVHYLDENNPFQKHGDLLIEIPDWEDLLTYEIDRYYLEFIKKYYQNFYLITQDTQIINNSNTFLKVYNSISEVINKHSRCDIIKIPLERKENHKKEYLSKEGMTGSGKGFIKEFTFSHLSGIIRGNIDMLILIDKD